LNRAVSKTVERVTPVPRVRIPPPPLTLSLLHPAELTTAGKVELRCVRSLGLVELSHVRLVALPVAGLAIGPQPTIGLKKPASDAMIVKPKPRG
jgi:hypothetical protein